MTETIQKLREATGAGIMSCKLAFEEANGDFDKALKIIEEKGLFKAIKKENRRTGSGLLHSYIHLGKIGVLLELRCETDFVARTEDFKKLAHELAMQIAAMAPQNTEGLLKEEYIREPGTTVDELVKKAIAKLGENIKIERFCRYEL